MSASGQSMKTLGIGIIGTGFMGKAIGQVNQRDAVMRGLLGTLCGPSATSQSRVWCSHRQAQRDDAAASVSRISVSVLDW